MQLYNFDYVENFEKFSFSCICFSLAIVIMPPLFYVTKWKILLTLYFCVQFIIWYGATMLLFYFWKLYSINKIGNIKKICLENLFKYYRLFSCVQFGYIFISYYVIPALSNTFCIDALISFTFFTIGKVGRELQQNPNPPEAKGAEYALGCIWLVGILVVSCIIRLK